MRPSPVFKIVLLVAIGVFGATALTLLHLDNRRLRRVITARQETTRPAAALREENAVLKKLVDDSQRNAASAAENVHADLQRAQFQIAQLEKQAEVQRTEKAQRDERLATMLATNRDPLRGFVRLEHFQNQGQSTPSAAFQTMVWAALKGEDAALANICKMSNMTRIQAEALIARLPHDGEEQWTPAKLAALWVDSALLEVSALQITGESRVDPEHAIVTVRAPDMEKDEKIKLNLTPSGWKVMLPTNAIEKIESRIGAKKS
jgi:hypothetical protein